MAMLFGIGKIVWFILKAVVKIILGILWLAVEMMKILLMMLCFVFKMFLLFVDGAVI